MAYDDDYEWFEPDPNQLMLPFEDEPEQLGLGFGDADEDLTERAAAQHPDSGSLYRYQIPTATSNPARPRTVAAKFMPEEQAIYVVMRSYATRGGGIKTPIVKYYPCDAKDWANFKRAYSKGQFIAQNWDGYAGARTKDWEEVGTLGMDNFLLQAANYARAMQKDMGGIQFGQSEKSDVYKKLRRAVARGEKVTQISNRTRGGLRDRLGGTGRKREQNSMLDEAVKQFYRNNGRINP